MKKINVLNRPVFTQIKYKEIFLKVAYPITNTLRFGCILTLNLIISIFTINVKLEM